jgi:hypothetical protein
MILAIMKKIPDHETTGSPPLIGFCCWEAAQEVLASLIPDLEATGSLRLPRQVDTRSIESPALRFS